MKVFRTILIAALFLLMSAVSYAQDPGMMDPGKGKQSHSNTRTIGQRLFNHNCSRCHPNGGNIIVPSLPLIGSSKLENFKTFLSFIRNPKMPDGSEGVMPDFSKKLISDQDAKTLYGHIISAGTSGMMGNGMMGRYNNSKECQQFLDDTAGLRKELSNKRFDYSEAYRNSQTTPDILTKLEREIFDLQKKIFAKAPLGCSW